MATPSTETSQHTAGPSHMPSLVIATIMIAILAVAHIIIRPNVIQVFADFDTDLPWLTLKFVNINEWMTAIIALACIAVLAFLNRAKMPSSTKRHLNLMAVILIFMAGVFWLAGVFIPLVKVQQSVM